MAVSGTLGRCLYPIMGGSQGEKQSATPHSRLLASRRLLKIGWVELNLAGSSPGNGKWASQAGSLWETVVAVLRPAGY